MKRLLLFCLSIVATISAVAEISVCKVFPDDNGNFDCPYIKSGTITWNENSRTLTLDNAVVEYSSETPYDYISPIRVTEDATIVIHGDCKLTSTGFVAMSLDGYNSKNVTIQGDGNLYISSNLRGIFLVCTRLTIKDITMQNENGIQNNAEGVLCKLTFDHVSATIKGGVYRIREGIHFTNCAITYPRDAYIEHDQYEDTDYGYYIAYGEGNTADHIIISRTSKIRGDVNGDGEVNIADVNAIISMILGNGNYAGADVNLDGEVNIADVNAVINIILFGDTEQDGHEWVDLGLPSGTLWATCNVGASSPEEYGDYFAWGETAPKEIYSWVTYKWCNGTNDTMTKYCTDSSFGTVDGKTELLPEDDAAYVNWGSSWRMPTKEQCMELSNNCTWTWTTLKGVNGQLVTGPNGNTMFLPAAGDRYNNKVGDLGSYGQFWSRMVHSSNEYAAFILFLHSNELIGHYGNERYLGFSVRAVRVP